MRKLGGHVPARKRSNETAALRLAFLPALSFLCFTAPEIVKPYCRTVTACTARPLGTGCVRVFRSGGPVSPQRIFMSKNIYVGKLTFQTTPHELRGPFAPYGTLTPSPVASHRDTRRSPAFGLPDMSPGGRPA